MARFLKGHKVAYTLCEDPDCHCKDRKELHSFLGKPATLVSMRGPCARVILDDLYEGLMSQQIMVRKPLVHLRRIYKRSR